MAARARGELLRLCHSLAERNNDFCTLHVQLEILPVSPQSTVSPTLSTPAASRLYCRGSCDFPAARDAKVARELELRCIRLFTLAR